jgi:hypothetical protein
MAPAEDELVYTIHQVWVPRARVGIPEPVDRFWNRSGFFPGAQTFSFSPAKSPVDLEACVK